MTYSRFWAKKHGKRATGGPTTLKMAVGTQSIGDLIKGTERGVLFMLNNLDALGKAERLAGTEQGGDVVMPAIRARDFNFTSLSEAV